MGSDDHGAFSFDVATGLWRCAYCIDDPGLESEKEKQAHSLTRRHQRLREQYIEQGNSSHGCIEQKVEGSVVWWECTICLCRIDNCNHIIGHLVGTKHRRCLKRRRWYSSSTDPGCEPPMIVHCVGDSHGGKYLFQSMSPRVRCHFITGTMYSFATGRRPVNLKALGVRSGQAVLFSYGEIDVRRHIERLSLERGHEYESVIDPLVGLYISEIVRQLALFRNELVAVVMAVPPPSDRRENPRVPYYGKLSDRAVITKIFNKILEKHCTKQVQPKIHFFQPFVGYTKADGTLNHSYSDGHIHIDSLKCRPIHKQLTAQLAAV